MRLPSPPTNEEKYLYVNQNKGFLYTFGVLSLVLLITGMTLFVYQHPSVYFYSIFLLLLFFYLGLSYFIGIFGESFDLGKHKRILETYVGYEPTVDVYLPSCGEPTEIILNTFKYVSELGYPKEKLKVYVLDDKGVPEVKSAAENYGFEYISRPNKGYFKKAGNIRYAFPKTFGEFILILDADFVPAKDMLREMLPYFAHDPKTAIVQSPQYFAIYSEDAWTAKGAAYIQELFYRLIQVNRQTWNASICVGTCAIYRRAHLEPHGGTAEIEYSEDLHTGFQMTLDGNKVKYIPINVSQGVCPDKVSAFVTQQYRWCTGSFTLFLSRKFWASKMRFMTKLCYLSGMLYYVATALGLLFIPVPSMLMVWAFPEYVFWYNILFSLPSFLYGTFYLALWTKAPFGLYSLQVKYMSYWAHLLAIHDKLRSQTVAWIATGDTDIKNKSGKIYHRFKNYLFHWNIGLFAIVFAGIFYRMPVYGIANFLPSLFFTSLNFYLAMLLFRDIDE